MFRKIIPADVNPVCSSDYEQRISLSGVWQARIDPENIGIDQKWYEKKYTIMERVTVPGTIQGNGLGTAEPEQQKEFAVTFRPFKTTYCGPAWFAKNFELPENFKDKRVWLLFGGVAPTPVIWVNGVKIGDNHEPLVPFGYEITDVLLSGENRIAVRIDEDDRTAMLNYQYDGKWTGFYRDVELLATGPAFIEHFSAVPNVKKQNIHFTAKIGDAKDGDKVNFRVYSQNGAVITERNISVKEGKAEGNLAVENPVLWSPDSPVLYRVEAVLFHGKKIFDGRSARVGFVSFASEDSHFKINGEPYYFRGCGDFGTFPETGCPNNSREHWRKCLSQLRAYGYTAVRCQSHVPVSEYFDVADEVGLLVQSEMGIAGPICGQSNFHTYNQWPKPTPDFREQFRSQWNHIVMRDVCHPSANIYSMGNELGQGGNIRYPDLSWRCYKETKAIKPTALVIWTDGVYAGKYESFMPDDFLCGDAGLSNTEDKAVICHEFRWWSSSPEVRDIAKYDGLPVRPVGELWAIKATTDHGISHILEKMGTNSRKLQYMEAKCKLEGLRRDYPKLSGVSHFNATDIAISKQGILDEFYEQKYATAEMWQQVNGDTVILSSLNFDNRCYAFGSQFECKLFVSDFSHPAFASPEIKWNVKSDGCIIAEGVLTYGHTPFTTVEAGTVSFTVPKYKKPVSAELYAEFEEQGRKVKNSWRLWFFPETAEKALPENVRIVNRLDKDTLAFVENGGSVLVEATSEGFVRPFKECLGLNKGRYFFTKPATFFPFEELQDGTIIQNHPLFGDFPHEDYADMQFYNILADSAPLDLEPLGLNEADPVIRMIHSYIVSRSLGTLTERSYGDKGGRILLCSAAIESGRVEAAYLKKQIVKYLSSQKKAECAPLTEEALERLMSASALMNADCYKA